MFGTAVRAPACPGYPVPSPIYPGHLNGGPSPLHLYALGARERTFHTGLPLLVRGGRVRGRPGVCPQSHT